VLVFNDAGTVTSADAVLIVRLPILITQQPQSRAVRTGSNVTFSVTAYGNGPLNYQWLLNGAPLPQGTNATLTLPNAGAAQVGAYAALVSDSFSTIASATATLSLLLDPFIVQQPLSTEAVPGGTAILSVMVTNNATLPITYRWRQGVLIVSSNSLNQYVSFFAVSNVQANVTYNVVVSNPSRPSGIRSSDATITVAVDADHDGIPDDWESAWGLNSNNPLDAGLDYDGDGMTNLQEYIAGTDPWDSDSYLKVDQINATGTLQFTARAGRTYTILFQDGLNTGPWTRLSNIPAGNLRIVTVLDPNPGGNRFYRLVTPGRP